jgi:transposase
LALFFRRQRWVGFSEAARSFGFSRPSFYQAQAAFQQDGVSGLLPQKRGPQAGHKLTNEVMEFVVQQRVEDPSLTPEQLAQAIQKRFRIQVHPRSIQRRLRAEKKTTVKPVKPTLSNVDSAALRFSYEDLRAQVLAGGRGPGLSTLLGFEFWRLLRNNMALTPTAAPHRCHQCRVHFSLVKSFVHVSFTCPCGNLPHTANVEARREARRWKRRLGIDQRVSESYSVAGSVAVAISGSLHDL